MTIHYFSGATRANLFDHGIGFMLTPEMRTKAAVTSDNVWAADNGCFTHPERFDGDRYLAWLALRNSNTCAFATAPDVVGDAVETLRRSQPFFARIRAIGYRAAFIGQDGLEDIADQIPWDEFDAFFLGGSTEWKLSDAAACLVGEAKARGKWVHMGRVNSLKRLRYAQDIGCDSADGTYLAFGPDINLPRLLGWLGALRTQPAFAI